MPGGELAPTPVDVISGLPLPLAPYGEPLVAGSPDADWHHHFHPRRSPELQDLGGQAVRVARLQLTNYGVHHHEYHKTFGGPPLPRIEKEQFGLVVMATAGHVPELALAFRRHEPRIVPLSEGQRLHLQTSGEFRTGGRDIIRKFLQQYILGQSVGGVNINEETLDEFINTLDLVRRRELGHTLLALITEKATEPISLVYKLARKQGQIAPGSARSAHLFVKSRLGPKRMRNHLIDQLHNKLAA